MQHSTVRERHELGLSVTQFTNYLFIFVTILVIVNLIGHFAHYVMKFGAIELLHMNREKNIPTFFSSAILLLSSLLLGFVFVIIKRDQGRDRYFWLLLSVIFLGLAVDEYVSIHERMAEPVQSVVGVHPWLYYSWVLPAGLFLLILGAGLFRFVTRLPADTRNRFIIAGVIYVGGAVGIEIVGGNIDFFYGKENLTYNLIATLEETLEMVGIVLFIRALLLHIQHNLGGRFSVSIND